jgi:hypothetical protein
MSFRKMKRIDFFLKCGAKLKMILALNVKLEGLNGLVSPWEFFYAWIVLVIFSN